MTAEPNSMRKLGLSEDPQEDFALDLSLPFVEGESPGAGWLNIDRPPKMMAFNVNARKALINFKQGSE